ASPMAVAQCRCRKMCDNMENGGSPIAPLQPGISGVQPTVRGNPRRFQASTHHRGRAMADEKKRLDSNVTGNFFVDATCINCDTCRQLAPASFEEVGSFSAVTRNQLIMGLFNRP